MHPHEWLLTRLTIYMWLMLLRKILSNKLRDSSIAMPGPLALWRESHTSTTRTPPSKTLHSHVWAMEEIWTISVGVAAVSTKSTPGVYTPKRYWVMVGKSDAVSVSWLETLARLRFPKTKKVKWFIEICVPECHVFLSVQFLCSVLGRLLF